MGRLIELDAVIERLRRAYSQGDVVVSIWKLNALIDMMGELPPAYDKEKVLEQLRKMKPDAECFEDMNDYGEALSRYNNMMEIVNAGGVDKSDKLTLEQQIEFCGNKIENIKLKTSPETFVAIQESLKELQKIKQVANNLI